MNATIWTWILLAGVALVVLPQMLRALGRLRGAAAGVALIAAMGGGWWLLGRSAEPRVAPADWSAVASVSSETCAKCHAEHYDSWHRTYHRTMTRDASPETVKGDFNNSVYHYQGIATTLTREGDSFFMKTVDLEWAKQRALAGDQAHRLPPPQYVKLSVDRLVGSHWVQEYMHKDSTGKYSRLPVLYHIVEKRWVHGHGAFLAPESDDFWGKCRDSTGSDMAAWNETCLYCHNTGPVQNAIRGSRGRGKIGFETEVAELGISCEACHGPGDEHIRANQNPARRFDRKHGDAGDPTIVHPEKLPVARRDEICARCHGAIVPKPEMWNARTAKDPFIAGQDLGKFNHFFRSEAERDALLTGRPGPARTESIDGRFWGDGTPLTTALEYNGMALSACYEKGQGKLSCLSCHQMHTGDPNFLLKPGMKTNEACYQCHADYRDRLAQHTRHGADSSGSKCANCHMPHQVYSLFTSHISHRIQIPDVKDSMTTGKPNACNLCHLDKSLGWTQDNLSKWSDRQKKMRVNLSDEEKNVSSALLLLARGDARSRALVAAAFSNPDAQRAAGIDWFGPFLSRLLDPERYPAVRYLVHRGLRRAYDDTKAGPYDYLALPPQRALQTRALRERFDAEPVKRPLPFLPLTPRGLPDEAILNRLLKTRTDPNLTINE